MSITLESILDLILGNLGTLVILLVILYGGYKKWWVFGWYSTELSKRIDKLEARLDKVSKEDTGLTDRVVTLVEEGTRATDA